MPYWLIELGDEVVAMGRKGVVIGKGNPANKSAHWLVRFPDGDVVWFSRDEVTPAKYTGPDQYYSKDRKDA